MVRQKAPILLGSLVGVLVLTLVTINMTQYLRNPGGIQEIDVPNKEALERIKDKTYGVCVPAGRRIALERLEALPYAETCVDCKARAERRR